MSLENITLSKRSQAENIRHYVTPFTHYSYNKINETECLGSRGRKTGEGWIMNVRLLSRVIEKVWTLVLKLQTLSVC